MNDYKYPRTCHLPWSEGISDDDKVVKSLDHFYNKEIVVWEKLDGENTTMTKNRIYARSIDSKDHESRHWIKKFWNDNIRYMIPENFRICGENLFAMHSIKYKNLKSYFYGFAIYDENNICLSFKDTLSIFSEFGIQYPEIFYDGKFEDYRHENVMVTLNRFDHEIEGYVLRSKGSFHYNDHYNNVVKYVRKNHINSDNHWMYKKIERNELSM